MNINELEARTGITKQNIRFYERQGLLHPTRNPENNYRQYTEVDVGVLQIVKVLRKLDLPIEDIRRILEGELPLGDAMKHQAEVLIGRQKELDAGIHICRTLVSADLETFRADETLRKMEELERKGGRLMSIIDDYKRFAKSEAQRSFSFVPDNMALTPAEFTEALFQYADENHLELVITREGMYPIFEIEGVEYTAERTFGRFGAVIHCTMSHPEELEPEFRDIAPTRRKLFRMLGVGLIPAVLLVYFIAVSRSVVLGLLMGLALLPLLCWTYMWR